MNSTKPQFFIFLFIIACISAENVSFRNVSLSNFHKEIVKINSSNSLKTFIPETPLHFVIVSGRIPILYKDSVTDIDNVNELYFRKNAIEDIEPGAFRNLSSVTSLSIIHGKLNTIKNGVFHNLTLHELQLSYHPLSKIHPGIFGNLSNLTVLSLDNNKIDTIEDNSFANLTKLEILDLSNNLITEIPSLAHLPTLKMLILAGNKFGGFKKEIFHNKNIQHLDLSSNEISTIPENLLDFLPNLNRIILNHNNITSIQKGIFNNRSLLQIELNNNKISHIDPEAFDNMPNLANIMLNSNQIRHYNPRWFLNSPNIYRLFLGNNLIEELPNEAFKNIYNNKRQWLKLGSNKIKKISPETFKGFEFINSLDLQHNEIEIWDASFLKDAKLVDFVNLLFNKIKCPQGDFDQVFKANKTYLEGNPLDDECIDRIKHWQSENSEKLVCIYLESC